MFFLKYFFLNIFFRLNERHGEAQYRQPQIPLKALIPYKTESNDSIGFHGNSVERTNEIAYRIGIPAWWQIEPRANAPIFHCMRFKAAHSRSSGQSLPSETLFTSPRPDRLFATRPSTPERCQSLSTWMTSLAYLITTRCHRNYHNFPEGDHSVRRAGNT